MGPGEVLLVIGPSGSGKSTIARAIAGLVPGDIPGALTGELRIGDAPPSTGAAGIVFQDPASQLVMERAGDDVAFGLENLAWPLDAMRRRVPAALVEVGLAGFEERRTTRLSGGEQQRLALAGVLAPDRPVLVLDEPTANLDPVGTAAFFERLRALAAERTRTIVLVEHRVDAAWPLADRVLALGADGRVIDHGPPGGVLERSRTQLETAGTWLPEAGAASSPPARRRPSPSMVSSTGTPSIDVREAWFEYDRGHPVLHGVGLAVAPGERVCLTGPNGSGKTTLLRLITGSLRPRAGAVRLLGDDPSRLRPAELARRLGVVVQDPELGFMGDTVGEELALGLGEADREHAEELAARLGLDLATVRDRSPYLLSGGEQRRVSLVTALARRPAVLILDEPTFGQDRHGWEALVAAIQELVDAGTAVLASTHDERFVAAIADRVVELEDGWARPA